MSPHASRTARLALLICALATVFASPALAREQQPGRIAFDHIVFGGPTDIFTINLDGKSRSRLGRRLVKRGAPKQGRPQNTTG